LKILLIHNSYAGFSGEEAVVEMQKQLLQKQGHEVLEYSRSSAELKQMAFGRLRAFFLGLRNERTIREIRQIIVGSRQSAKSAAGSRRSAVSKVGSRRSAVSSQQNKDIGIRTEDCRLQTADWSPPDIVHIHNLYPLISPAILPVIKSSLHHSITPSPDQNGEIAKWRNGEKIMEPPKIVMTVHNYRLLCPNGLFFTHGEICERCAGGKEWNCIARNCEGTVFKSAGYALRNLWARKRRYYLDNVDAFLCLTAFQRNKLVENGFPGEKCFVLPNFSEKKKKSIHPDKSFVFWAGRINAQKGFDIMAIVAFMLPEIPFRIAGSDTTRYQDHLPLSNNLSMVGKLSKEEMERSFNDASFLVFTSLSYEGFPMVFLEAMAAGIPVIAPRMAGFPEIIEDGFNGLLFDPGDSVDLAKKIEILWNDKELRTRMGENGRKKLEENYSPEVYYRKLMAVYEEVRRIK
jgi:glycosyltransferase involved in cell wall biosynthesis